MNITSEKLANGIVLRLCGQLDAASAALVDAALCEALEAVVPRVIVDMAKVDYISSAGVRSLLSAFKRVQSEDRFLELIRAQVPVRKVLTVVGLGDLLPMGEGTMQILDVLKRQNPVNEQALRNARQFLLDLFRVLGIESDPALRAVDSIFDTCRTYATINEIENELKNLLLTLDLGQRINANLKQRSHQIYQQVSPFVGSGSILDVGCGDGMIAQALAGDQRKIQLTDVVNYNQTQLPFALYDGLSLPFPSKSFDYCFLITVLHHCDDPLCVLREAIRVTRKRIIVNESVYLNEVNRRFNMFFDWFYNCVLHDNVNVPFNFNSPEGWEYLFRNEGLSVAASQDIGLDQVAVPEYHWMYVLDIPQT